MKCCKKISDRSVSLICDIFSQLHASVDDDQNSGGMEAGGEDIGAYSPPAKSGCGLRNKRQQQHHAASTTFFPSQENGDEDEQPSDANSPLIR